MKIYGGKAFKEVLKGKIRSNRPEWLAEELGIEYERVSLNAVPDAEHKKPEYLKINPFAKFPAIQDGDFNLFESAALCHYLAEKHKKFIPAAGTPDYYLCLQWCYFAMTNIESNALLMFIADNFLEAGTTADVLRNRGGEKLPQFLGPLNDIFEKQETIMKSGFTIADILLTTSLLYAKEDLLSAYPNVQGYLDRMSKRPAFKRSQELNGV
jgi:glutathione S-transferase